MNFILKYYIYSYIFPVIIQWIFFTIPFYRDWLKAKRVQSSVKDGTVLAGNGELRSIEGRWIFSSFLMVLSCIVEHTIPNFWRFFVLKFSVENCDYIYIFDIAYITINRIVPNNNRKLIFLGRAKSILSMDLIYLKIGLRSCFRLYTHPYLGCFLVI